MYYNYKCCEPCSNNPKNGGSGICNCTLPYYEQSTTPLKTYWNDYTYWPNTYTYFNYKETTSNKYTYRKKSSDIEAIQWTGDNYVDVCLFMSREALREKDTIIIETLNSKMKVEIGDYIIKGINNTFYPCKPDVFEKEYEKI